MKYITLADLSKTIRDNLWKIPKDIDFVIGVPRSGTMVASIICSYLNVPLIDVNSYVAGLKPSGGRRLAYYNQSHIKSGKVLVVEDTVYYGHTINKAKQLLESCKRGDKLIYMCAYLEGPGENAVDFYLEDVRQYTNNFTDIVYYEWNLFQHGDAVTRRWMCDIDGVFLPDPPDERNQEEYIKYIQTAPSLFVPLTPVGALVTYRLIKYADITTKWLADNGIRYDELYMFKADSWQERHDSGKTPELIKANAYKASPRYNLFIESSDYQAKLINQLSGKPVYCVETNKVYQ